MMHVDPAAIEREVRAFYGPLAARRVFRAGSFPDWKRAEQREEREPGSRVCDRLDQVEEARIAYGRTWTVEDVIAAVVDLRGRGYDDIRPRHDGRIEVHVRRDADPEPKRRAVPWVPVVRFRFDRDLTAAEWAEHLRAEPAPAGAGGEVPPLPGWVSVDSVGRVPRGEDT